MLKTGIRCNLEGKKIEKHIKHDDEKTFNGNCGEVRYMSAIWVALGF
ncbi:hypothetical protein [Acetivibrio straminisolvens]|jgi:hypothetical protein|nr:hypothetical protein [Acetivibrio straminisolvens]